MAAIDWEIVQGQKLTGEESREASDFEEILDNFRLEIDQAYKMFGTNELSLSKRIYFAAKVSLDMASEMVLFEKEPRVREILKSRLTEERNRQNGGIIIL